MLSLSFPPNPFSQVSSSPIAKPAELKTTPQANLHDEGILVLPHVEAKTTSSGRPELDSSKFSDAGTQPYRRLEEVLCPRTIELLARDRLARVRFFSALERSSDTTDVCAALHRIISADGPKSYWFLRKNAFEYLRTHSAAPLSSSLTALASAKDSSLKGIIVSTVVKDLSFPLSLSAQVEVARIGPMGGALCNNLLVDTTGIGDQSAWVLKFPQLVRSWILACSAVGVEHGVDTALLKRFSRDAAGPLNDWHVRRALEPLEPLSWGGLQAALRRFVRC